MSDTAAGAAGRSPHARLSQLDGLRGIAALVLMMYHADIVFRLPGMFERGYLLVDLFFMLSGFVLAVSTEKKLTAGIGAFAFAWSRYKRLFPLVAVGIAVALARAVAIAMADPLTLLAWLALDLAMVPSLAGTGPFYRLNNPQWTLFWELVLNFVHALLLRRVPTGALPVLAAALGAALIATVHFHGSDTLGPAAPTWRDWWMPIPRVAFPYVLGVWLGRKHLGGWRTPPLPWLAVLALPVVATALLPLLPLGRPNGDLVFVMILLPAALWATVTCHPPQRLMPALDWLGTFSLPLYCVHLTVLVWLSELLGPERWVQTLAIAASLAVAWAASRLISFKAKPTEVRPRPT